MNRILKLRAWDKKEKHFIDEFSITENGSPFIINMFERCENPDVILSQFTGMKDKNGKEIWEGDIVKASFMYHGKPGTSFTAFIFYNEDIGSFRIGYDSLGGGSQDEIYFTYQIEVIGNIFENKNLLKA